MANELLASGHIIQEDLSTLLKNLDELIRNPQSNKIITFETSIGLKTDEKRNALDCIGNIKKCK